VLPKKKERERDYSMEIIQTLCELHEEDDQRQKTAMWSLELAPQPIVIGREPWYEALMRELGDS
jgi:hypothetical protein